MESSAKSRGSGKVLPNYLIIGTQRGGTSALARGIANHPDVYLAPGKEMHYFDRSYHEGPASYERHFAGADGFAAVGEATPDYMYIEEARMRMASDLPGVRLIAILRDPVARAYSAYWHNTRRGNEDLSFEEALEAEEDRLAGSEWERYRLGYMSRGRYLEQLRRLEELMPNSPLLVLFNDDLRRHRSDTLRRTWEFLGVEPEKGSVEETERSRGKVLLRRVKAKLTGSDSYDRTYQPMTHELRVRLVTEMRDTNRELEEHLGVDLSHWRRI